MPPRGYVLKPMEARFLEKVAVQADGCWQWNGATNGQGYGVLQAEDRQTGNVYAHRYSYQRTKGPVPAGLDLDHLCRNPRCVNPDHLEAVTTAENLRRGMHPNMQTHREGICRRGHPQIAGNTYHRRDGRVFCKLCAGRARLARRAGQTPEPWGLK